MKRLMVLALGLVGLAATPLQAEENPFGYSYTADTEERGETELTFWATDRRGKADGHYDAQDYRLEAEHGFTDRFQVAAYANLASHHIGGLEEIGPVHRNFAFQGASVEFKYRLLDESRHGIGLALYAEPGWSRIHSVEGEKGAEYELELKAIFSKKFLDGRMLWAGNLTFEPEWEHELEEGASGSDEKDWRKELKLAASTGLAYRFSPSWYAGIEARYASVYPNWTHGLHREAYAVSAGPTIAVSSKEWSASLSFLPQLFGGPSPGGSRNLGEFEKREIRLKISHEF